MNILDITRKLTVIIINDLLFTLVGAKNEQEMLLKSAINLFTSAHQDPEKIWEATEKHKVVLHFEQQAIKELGQKEDLAPSSQKVIDLLKSAAQQYTPAIQRIDESQMKLLIENLETMLTQKAPS